LFAVQFGCATVFASEIFPQFNMLQKEPLRWGSKKQMWVWAAAEKYIWKCGKA